jgi:hypothetical protein
LRFAAFVACSNSQHMPREESARDRLAPALRRDRGSRRAEQLVEREQRSGRHGRDGMGDEVTAGVMLEPFLTSRLQARRATRVVAVLTHCAAGRLYDAFAAELTSLAKGRRMTRHALVLLTWLVCGAAHAQLAPTGAH